jgi:prophage regulatory protein
MNQLPQTGFVKLFQIIGNKKTEPPVSAIIPVSKSTWWAGVKSGRYPQPVKIGARCTAWKVEDVRAFVESVGAVSYTHLTLPTM